MDFENGMEIPVSPVGLDENDMRVEDCFEYTRYYSSSPQHATFDERGTLTTHKPGELHVTIVAKTKEGKILRSHQDVKIYKSRMSGVVGVLKSTPASISFT